MKTKITINTLLLFLIFSQSIFSQIDDSLLKRTEIDSSKYTLNMDAVYNRPFLGVGKSPVSLGGYLEVNWQHLGLSLIHI